MSIAKFIHTVFEEVFSLIYKKYLNSALYVCMKLMN